MKKPTDLSKLTDEQLQHEVREPTGLDGTQRLIAGEAQRSGWGVEARIVVGPGCRCRRGFVHLDVGTTEASFRG